MNLWTVLLVSSKRGQNSWPASSHITWRLSRWLNYFLSSRGKWTMNNLRQPMHCGAWRSSSPVAKIYERELWSLPHTADCFSENSIASDPGFSQPCSTPTRPWALFIQKKIWNYHRSTGRKERVLYASIWGRVLCITKHASEIVLEWQTKRRIRFKTVCTRMLKNPESKKKKKKKSFFCG